MHFAFSVSKDSQSQILIFPTPDLTEQATAAAATAEAAEETTDEVRPSTDKPQIVEPDTPAPMPSRGDGPQNVPKVKNTGPQITQSVSFYLL